MKKLLLLLFLLYTLYSSLFTNLIAVVPENDYNDTIWNRILREQARLSTHKGLILMEQENYFEALKEFSDALLKNPDDPYAHLAYGCGLYWVGDVDKALDEFQTALRLDGKNALAFHLVGIVHAYNGETGMALENFLKANEYSPERGDIKMNLGSIYHSMGNYVQAMRYLRQAVAIEPKNPLFHFQLGLLYSRLERLEDAKKSFQNALSIFSDYEDAMLELAVLEEKDGNIPEALKLYARALKIKPMDKVARFKFAFALLRQGNEKEAKNVLNEGFALSRTNDKGGISMSIAYAGNLQTENNRFSQDISSNPFLNSLAKIPIEDEIKIKIELIQIPKLQISKETEHENKGLLNKSLEKTLNYADLRYLKREYIIPSEDSQRNNSPSPTLRSGLKQERMKKISDISSDIDRMMHEVSAHGEVKMSIKVETERKIYAQKNRNKTPADTGKKVLYNPREVGNDMGLWVLGNNWIELVEEGISEIHEWMQGEKRPPGGFEYIILGLGNLILGKPENAIDYFITAKDDKLQDLSNLGISVAWVEKGHEDKSLYFCEKAIQSNPGNTVAIRNKKWLETPSAEPGLPADEQDATQRQAGKKQ